MKSNYSINNANTVLDLLKKDYPKAGCALNYDTKFHLLIAVALSAQTTDVSVNKITPILWNKYPDSKALSEANQKDVEEIIKSIGLYKNKSKNIIGISKALQKRLNNLDDIERKKYEDPLYGGSACGDRRTDPWDFRDRVVHLSGAVRNGDGA